MADVFASGRIVDIVIAFMAVEAMALLLLRHRLGFRVPAIDVALLLVPGFCLLMAMRAALSGSDWPVMAAWLLAALAAHLADLARRARHWVR